MAVVLSNGLCCAAQCQRQSGWDSGLRSTSANKVQKLVEALTECGLAYSMVAQPGEMLAYADNGAGQMLSAMDCWNKGLKMW